MEDSADLVSLRKTARLAGFFYVLVIVTAPLAVMILLHFKVAADPAAAVANILAHKALFRLGCILDLLSGACYLAVTALLYRVLRAGGKALSIAAVLFSTIGVATGAVSLVFRLAPLTLFENAGLLAGFDALQLQALSMFCLRLRSLAEHVGIVYFGFYCVLIGILVFRSKFLPGILGAGMMLAGAGWLLFLYEPLALAAGPVSQICSALGEISFALYLLIVGISEQRWQRADSH